MSLTGGLRRMRFELEVGGAACVVGIGGLVLVLLLFGSSDTADAPPAGAVRAAAVTLSVVMAVLY